METNVSHTNASVSAGPKPSLFELVAEESLNSLLFPAFQHVSRIINAKWPGRLVPHSICQYNDEAFAVVKALIDSSFIHRHNATFTEHFYGLVRCRKGNESSLSTSQKVASIATSVLMPYMLRKLQKGYENNRSSQRGDAHEASDPPSSEQVSYVRFMKFQLRKLCELFPYIDAVSEALRLTFYLLYVLAMSRRHSFIFVLLGLYLRYRGPEDKLPEPEMKRIPWMPWMQSFVIAGRKVAGAFLGQALPGLVFFIKFLEWWYEEGMDTKAHSINTLPTPTPPDGKVCPVPKISTRDFALIHPLCCPVCQQAHNCPTTLTISGYVFCYKCIVEYINTHGRCPVTRVKCTWEELVRLYLD